MSSRSAAQTRSLVEKSLRRRYWAERRFRFYGLGAVLLGVVFVVFLFGTIIAKGYSAFRQATVTLEVTFDPAVIDPAPATTAPTATAPVDPASDPTATVP